MFDVVIYIPMNDVISDIASVSFNSSFIKIICPQDLEPSSPKTYVHSASAREQRYSGQFFLQSPRMAHSVCELDY